MNHHLELIRFDHGDDYTHGILRIDGKFECFAVEDEHRDEKVKGETRIPEGLYPLRFKEKTTPLTTKYRTRYPWFTWHLEICEIPNFTNIYLHVGNDDDDTDGCLCLGQTCDTKKPNGFVGRSRQAYEAFYKKVSPWLREGAEVKIHAINL